jgi:hypothetical protein
MTLIVPNTWLTNLLLINIRKFITLHNSLLSIVHFVGKIFKAVVDNQIIIIKKCTPSKQTNIIVTSNINLLMPKRTISFSELKNLNGQVINIFISDEEKILKKKMEHVSSVLRENYKVRAGVKPYEIGKGIPPQTKEDVRRKIYNAEYQLDESYRPYLRGSDIEQFLIRWQGNHWIRYGKNLAAPRKIETFQLDRKIVIRQTGDSLIASMDTQKYICLNNMHVIEQVNELYTLEYLLTLSMKLLTG